MVVSENTASQEASILFIFYSEPHFIPLSVFVTLPVTCLLTKFLEFTNNNCNIYEFEWCTSVTHIEKVHFGTFAKALCAVMRYLHHANS